MKTLTCLSRTAFFGLTTLLSGPGVAQASAGILEDEALIRWKSSTDEMRDMNPKWGQRGIEAFKASLGAGVAMQFHDVPALSEWQQGIIEGAMLIELNLPSNQRRP